MADDTPESGTSLPKPRGSTWVELAKPPILVFSILLALIIGRFTLGLQFGQVEKISSSGVEFQKSAGIEIGDMNSRLNGALAAISQLQQSVPESGASAPAAMQAAVVEASQSVSDQAARLADISAGAKSTAPVRGYIWLGDFKGTQWQHVKVAWVSSGLPVDKAPSALVQGVELKLLGNMVVRDGQPANDADYFNGRKSLGVAPVGTRVRIVSPPILVDRPFGTQCWAQVDIL